MESVENDASAGPGQEQDEEKWNGLYGLAIIYFKGLAMGCADAVPGVSGGTIALITGIYERLITAVTALDPTVLKRVPTLHTSGGRSRFLADLRAMDVPFLLALGTGMVTAVIVLARLVQVALQTIPGPTYAFFFGLIGASALVLGRLRWLTEPVQVGAAVAGFSIAFAIAGVSGQGYLASSLPVVFVAGSVAISGMVLPGISGAFILLLLGQYDYLTATLNGFVDAVLALASEGISPQLLQEGTVVAVFLAGALTGLFTIAFIVREALERYRAATLAFLVSLMIGSLRLPVLEMRAATTPTTEAIAGLAAAGFFGAILVFALDQATTDLTY